MGRTFFPFPRSATAPKCVRLPNLVAGNKETKFLLLTAGFHFCCTCDTIHNVCNRVGGKGTLHLNYHFEKQAEKIFKNKLLPGFLVSSIYCKETKPVQTQFASLWNSMQVCRGRS